MNVRTASTYVVALFASACGGGGVGSAAAGAGSGTGGGGGVPSPAASAPVTAEYYAYVGAESADLIHRIKLDASGVSIDQTTPVGEISVETEGPHGLSVSPDGRYLYMTTAHGVPDGKLWKFEAGPDTLVAAPILLGNFPATLDLTPDGLYAFVANFNLHGEHVASTVSVVYTPDMVEVDQIPTCTMPHGLRMAPDGLFAYTNCMMDDQLVEIDTRTFEVSRRFTVSTGEEGELTGYGVPEVLTGANGMTRSPSSEMDGATGMRGMNGMEGMRPPTCSPTWVQPAPDDRTLYVACNKSDEILVIDRVDWTLVRKFPAGRAPYNLGITPDGAILVASLKSAGQVQFFDAATGESMAVVPSSTTVTHGVAVTPDSRFAFVSVEGKGAEPGKVDVYDLRSFELVGSVGVGQQAGGIIFWRMDEG
jgi:DNA-binding beta-propeller fold protein YncE